MPKLLSTVEAAAQVRARDTLGIPLGPGQPAAFLRALGTRDDFEDLEVFGALLIELFPLFTRRGVHLRSGFFGPVERALRDSGFDVQFVPADFRRFAAIVQRMRPRVMVTAATPPDADGHLSLSLHAGATVEELQRAGRDPERLLIVETNPSLPRTLGLPPQHPHQLTLDAIDIVVESDAPLFTIEDPPPSDTDRAIASHARRFIRDGCTLQTGIGAIPSEIAELLAADAGGDYGIHSEMFTDGLMRLHEAGKVTNRKGHYDGISITTFAAGSRTLYDWLDGNEQVRFLPVDCVNSHSAIARNRQMVSINGALAVDLTGQIAADALNGRQYSGIGGHMDFISGASRSAGGRALVCLPSTVSGEARRVTRIVDVLPPASYVTTPRHEVDVVITEYGAAELADRTVDERAEALIGVAHPDLRDGLREAWAKQTSQGKDQ